MDDLHKHLKLDISGIRLLKGVNIRAVIRPHEKDVKYYN